MSSQLNRELELPQIDWLWPLVALGWSLSAIVGLAVLALSLDIIFAITGNIGLWRALFGPVLLTSGVLIETAAIWRWRIFRAARRSLAAADEAS